MLSVRPRIAELVFQLYGRSLHPELFEILGTRRIERGGYIANVQITNAGHVVTWQYDGITLTEVAASAQHPLPQRRRLMSHRLKGTCTDHASSSHAESSVSSPTITPSEPEQESAPEMVVREEYEIIKRGRGRPRKDGLPNKSSIAIKRKVLTPREKRDAAVARKREREMEKVKARNSAAAAPTNSASSSSVRPNGDPRPDRPGACRRNEPRPWPEAFAQAFPWRVSGPLACGVRRKPTAEGQRRHAGRPARSRRGSG